MPKAPPMADSDAVSALLAAFVSGAKYGPPRMSLQRAKEITKFSTDKLRELAAANSTQIGILLIRGYVFICTAEEKKKAERSNKKPGCPL